MGSGGRGTGTGPAGFQEICMFASVKRGAADMRPHACTRLQPIQTLRVVVASGRHYAPLVLGWPPPCRRIIEMGERSLQSCLGQVQGLRSRFPDSASVVSRV